MKASVPQVDPKTYKADGAVKVHAGRVSALARPRDGEPRGDMIQVGSKANGDDDIVGSEDEVFGRRNQKRAAKHRDEADGCRPS